MGQKQYALISQNSDTSLERLCDDELELILDFLSDKDYGNCSRLSDRFEMIVDKRNDCISKKRQERIIYMELCASFFCLLLVGLVYMVLVHTLYSAIDYDLIGTHSKCHRKSDDICFLTTLLNPYIFIPFSIVFLLGCGILSIMPVFHISSHVKERYSKV